MPEEILRLKATVVSAEALANIRALGREIGIMPRVAGRGVAQLNTQFAILGKTIGTVGKEISTAIPALSGLSLGSAGVGLAFAGIIKLATSTADKLTKLSYASKELGLSIQELQGFSAAAEKVGVSTDTVMQSFENFKNNTFDFKHRIGELRGEVVKSGAPTVLARINAATTMLGKLKVAYDFKEILDKRDPSGEKGRRFFQMLQLSADMARISFADARKEIEKGPLFTEADIKRAKDFKAQMVDLARAWTVLSTSAGVTLFPGLIDTLNLINKTIEGIKEIRGMFPGGSVSGAGETPFRSPSGTVMEMGAGGILDPRRALGVTPDANKSWWENIKGLAAKGPLGRLFGGDKKEEPAWPPEGQDALRDALEEKARKIREQMERQQGVPGKQSNMAPGFQRASFGGESGASGASRIIQVGVFDALVQFKSYVEGGGVEGGGGSLVQKASYTPGGDNRAGVSSAGGGGGGGGGNGQSAPQPGAGGQGSGPAGAQLNDEGGKPIDPQTMKAAEQMGRAGDTAGLQKLFAQRGYKMSGRACGMVASAYVKSAGFKPPPGGAVASNWNEWGQASNKEDINKEGRPFGSMIASYNVRRYGGGLGSPLGKGQQGGHVMTIVPGTFNPKDNTAMFVDQSGKPHRRNIKNMDIRYAGDEAVAAAKAREQPGGAKTAAAGAPDGSTIPRPDGGGQGGSNYLRQSRDKFAKEMESDPELKKRIAALGTLESEGDPAAIENLYNRADYVGKSLAKSIGGGKKSFYDPVRKGKVEARIKQLEQDPERMKRALKVVDDALSTNITEGYTDQGSAGGPNMVAGGTGINRKGNRNVAPGTPGAERYNLFGGGPGGHRGAKEYKDRQQARVRAENEKAAQQARVAQATVPPAATGNVDVTVNSNGTKAEATAKNKGTLFRPPRVTQHHQMQPTEDASGAINI